MSNKLYNFESETDAMKPHFKIFSAFVLLLSAACTPSDELAVRNKGREIRLEQTAAATP